MDYYKRTSSMGILNVIQLKSLYEIKVIYKNKLPD